MIGSAEAGFGCFTCITGDSVPDQDYELEDGETDGQPANRDGPSQAGFAACFARSLASLGVRNRPVIAIVPFEPEHAEGIVSVILPIQQAEFDIPITLEAQPDLKDIPGFYQRGCGNFWVALLDGQVIGTVGLLDIGNKQAALRKMFVKAVFRGPEHRVAKRLLTQLLEWCRADRVKEVYLGTTAKFLAAHRFYEKNGFREIRHTELPSSFPVMVVDTKFYFLSLT